MGEPPFICPYCDVEIHLPDNVWYYTCNHCGKRLDLKSQFAYLRGLDAFNEGQDILQRLNPKKHRSITSAQDRAALELFREAYSSFQVAFLAELEEFQRTLGVEMMTSMAHEFMKRGMISSLEANYWNSLMVEQTAQNEYDLLNGKIVKADDLTGYFKRWQWRSRQKRLLEALAKIAIKIQTLEISIDFIDIPRARNKKWKP
ncbi:MAG: hypothetical protein ABSE06_02735 [Anaerolineaceae bacterium]|jgi:hypothetical protein